uniref:Uncharacterized protein n=1 Tax=Tanacetum cinerariifolium TaxID=118510 RepID=A0A6L2NKC8_TANCI|nr:hypothetical protein [Tanacetum cinerariifolium]
MKWVHLGAEVRAEIDVLWNSTGGIIMEVLGAGSSNMDGATRPRIAHGHQAATQFLWRQKKTRGNHD